MDLDFLLNFGLAALPYLEKAFGGMVLLFVVVGIHEFGHFITAKYVGARVDIFSIGFGKPIVKKTFGETEYRICWIPLGGYVKIYGQDPEEVADDPSPEPEKSLSNKPLPGRILVFSGGPLFNFILSAFVFGFLAFIGVYVMPAKATRVVANSPAWNAGLRSGDEIVSVNDKEVRKFNDVVQEIAKYPGEKIAMTIMRGDQKLEFTVPVQNKESFTPYGERITAGTLNGLEREGREPIVATTTESNTWGFQHNDRILSVQGTAVNSWEDLELFFERNMNELPDTLTFEVMREEQKITLETPDLSWLRKRISTDWDSHRLMETVGLYSPELFVKEILANTPAERSELKTGDRIISVNGNRIYSFNDLRNEIQAAGESQQNRTETLASGADSLVIRDAVELLVEREGRTQRIRMDVAPTKTRDPLGKSIVVYTIGIRPAFTTLQQDPADMILERTMNPFVAAWEGVRETGVQTAATLIGIKKLIFGEVSSKAIGGPIMIVKVAGDSFAYSWRAFLRLMAIISIALGVFNLLPVPVLDGGHIVFALIEAARGKPISPQAVQNVMKVGISLLLVLMVFATYNDIVKTFF